MKRIIIFLLIFICGCETTQTSIQKTIRNQKCEDVQSFKVFQVLDNFILANVCRDGDDEYCLGHTVYFQKEKDKIYYDDQLIKVNDNECAIYVGTYKYQTKNGYKTVPIVKIIDSRMPKAE
ncbi:MAG TPA: hypothetical protein P5295_09890 [Spirochaetota bacterium]|nr:hypothetical protein [Spirochaetota bacterium]